MRTPGQGGEAASKVLDEYSRDMPNEDSKLLLNFATNSELTPLNTFCCTPKSGGFYTFQSANHRKGQAYLDYILTKQAYRRLIRCVSTRRPSLWVSGSDHNFVYTNVSIPRKCSLSRRKDITKETPKMAGLRWLMDGTKQKCLAFVRTNSILDHFSEAPKRTWGGGI